MRPTRKRRGFLAIADRGAGRARRRRPARLRAGGAALSRQYNYLKFLLAKAREELRRRQLGPAELDRIVRLHDTAAAVRNVLVLANIRLVVHLSSRHLGRNRSLDELVSDGTVSLMQAIERFDYTRGIRFSTYASWPFSRTSRRRSRTRDRIRRMARTGSEEAIEGLRTRARRSRAGRVEGGLAFARRVAPPRAGAARARRDCRALRPSTARPRPSSSSAGVSPSRASGSARSRPTPSASSPATSTPPCLTIWARRKTEPLTALLGYLPCFLQYPRHGCEHCFIQWQAPGQALLQLDRRLERRSRQVSLERAHGNPGEPGRGAGRKTP